MTTPATLNILVGDDHRIVREGLKQVLADAPEINVVAEAETGPDVLQRVDALGGDAGPHAVLLDIALPGRDGMDVLQALKKTWPQLPVLMLSIYPEKQYAVRCIKLGAAGYLNQPEAVLQQVLTGKFADGLGNIRNVPDRANFDPVPWQSMAVWMLTQMKRWGYVKGEVHYKQIAEKVFLLTDAKKQMKLAGFAPAEGAYKKFKVMGKEFDPA